MVSARCRPGVWHYPEGYHYLHWKSIRPLCLAELPCPTVTRIVSPIVPVSSNFCCVSPFYRPLLERLPWSSWRFECHMTGCYSGQPPPTYRYFCTFHHETIGRASFHNLLHPGLEVYVSSLQFSNMEMYSWKAQPDLISTDSLTHCERIFHTGPQWP